MRNVDVAVIGAGPAGATFARLADARLSVALIDRGATGLNKPCGGLLSPDAQKVLSQFDLTLPADVLVSPQIFSVKTIDVVSGQIRHYSRSYLNMDRAAFDRWLVSLVPQRVWRVAGNCTHILRDRDGFLLQVTTDGSTETIRAKYLVGADGANSLVRRTFFPQKHPAGYLSIQQWFYQPNSSPFYSCIFDRETSDSCSWSISKNQYFIFGGAFPAKKCRENFEKQKERLQQRCGFTFGEPIRTEACRVLSPRFPRDFCTGADGVFLLGEAAGLISPTSFEGISWAMQSGLLLAELLHPDTVRPERKYRRATRFLRIKLLAKRLKYPFMYNPLLRRLVLRSGLSAIKMYTQK